MTRILKVNSFRFSDKRFPQTHGITMETEMAIAFAVIFVVYTARFHTAQELATTGFSRPFQNFQMAVKDGIKDGLALVLCE